MHKENDCISCQCIIKIILSLSCLRTNTVPLCNVNVRVHIDFSQSYIKSNISTYKVVQVYSSGNHTPLKRSEKQIHPYSTFEFDSLGRIDSNIVLFLL